MDKQSFHFLSTIKKACVIEISVVLVWALKLYGEKTAQPSGDRLAGIGMPDIIKKIIKTGTGFFLISRPSADPKGPRDTPPPPPRGVTKFKKEAWAGKSAAEEPLS